MPGVMMRHTEDSCSCGVQRFLVDPVLHSMEKIVGGPFLVQIFVTAALVRHVSEGFDHFRQQTLLFAIVRILRTLRIALS